MAVAIADWNSAMNGTGMYEGDAKRTQRTTFSIVLSRGVRWGRRFNREETLTPEQAVLDAEAAENASRFRFVLCIFKPFLNHFKASLKPILNH